MYSGNIAASTKPIWRFQLATLSSMLLLFVRIAFA